MPNSDSEDLRADLLSLLDQQLEVLELSACVPLTNEEQREYDARKQRIHELLKQLGRLRNYPRSHKVCSALLPANGGGQNGR